MEETEKIAVLRLTLWDFVPERLSEKGEEVFRHPNRFSSVVHGRDHGGADIHAVAHGGPRERAGGYYLQELHSVEDATGSPDRNCSLWRRTYAGAGEKREEKEMTE